MNAIASPPALLRTERLRLRALTLDDAEFTLELLNEPSFHRYIGDRGVRTLDDAREYLRKGALDSYTRHGFGMMLVELHARGGAIGEAIGMCGLVKRDALPDVDIGFAFLPRHWSRGYAYEAAAAVLAHARGDLGIARIAGIVSPDNASSIRVLEKLGLSYERMVRMAGDTQDIRYYASGV